MCGRIASRMWTGRAVKRGLSLVPFRSNSFVLLRPTKYLFSRGYQMENSSPREESSTIVVFVMGFWMFRRNESGRFSNTYPGALLYSCSFPLSVLPEVKLTFRFEEERVSILSS